MPRPTGRSPEVARVLASHAREQLAQAKDALKLAADMAGPACGLPPAPDQIILFTSAHAEFPAELVTETPRGCIVRSVIQPGMRLRVGRADWSQDYVFLYDDTPGVSVSTIAPGRVASVYSSTDQTGLVVSYMGSQDTGYGFRWSAEQDVWELRKLGPPPPGQTAWEERA